MGIYIQYILYVCGPDHSGQPCLLWYQFWDLFFLISCRNLMKDQNMKTSLLLFWQLTQTSVSHCITGESCMSSWFYFIFIWCKVLRFISWNRTCQRWLIIATNNVALQNFENMWAILTLNYLRKFICSSLKCRNLKNFIKSIFQRISPPEYMQIIN